MRLLAIVFAAAILLCAAGLLVRPRDPRLARLLFTAAAVLGALLAGGFFGLFGGA